MIKIPFQLAAPVVLGGLVVSKVMLDLTVYLKRPTEKELEFLLDLYEQICPAGRILQYKTAETEYWPLVAKPEFTDSGRAAFAAGKKWPYFEPSRRRIQTGRAFEAQVWDGREIDDPDGSWSFGCRRIHLRSTGLHAFTRILIPLKSKPEILRDAAIAIANNVAFSSGHGGLVFVYAPLEKEDALDAIYAQSRRFWGVDVEDINETLPLMDKGIKAVNWLTMVGNDFQSLPGIRTGLNGLSKMTALKIEQRVEGAVLIAGAEPVVGDQHRPDTSLDPYYAVAKALEPLFLKACPDFNSERFIKNNNTVGWIRRFIDPAGWR